MNEEWYMDGWTEEWMDDGWDGWDGCIFCIHVSMDGGMNGLMDE